MDRRTTTARAPDGHSATAASERPAPSAAALASPASTPAVVALHWLDGAWIEGDPPIIGALSFAHWMGSVVFDGARAFEGVLPDIDRHADRAIASAVTLGMAPLVTAEEIVALTREATRRLPRHLAYYVRPMFWADRGFVAPDPDSTRFCLTLFASPMPPFEGQSVTKAAIRRPRPDMAPTDAKAACLYPNAGRGLTEARKRGFQNAVVLDADGNVAELLTSNLFLVKDGVAITPVGNGCFLTGLTRRRVLDLLAADGVPTQERAVRYEELLGADELFSTGNYAKVQPITRIDDRDLPIGPITRRARALYWAFAHAG